MSRSFKRGIKYILNGVPEYNINVITSSFNDKNYLMNKNVLITGGSKGIGLSIAKRVIAGGGRVAITGRNKADLVSAKEKLGDNLFIYVLDNCDVDKFDSFFEKVGNDIGKINCLINNAGISLHEKSFEEVTPDTFDKQFMVNLKGTYFMTQKFIKYSKINKLKNQKIINIASETAAQPMYRPYGMTKAAIVSFTKWVAQQFILDGIRANIIAPGVTESNMTNYYTKGKSFNASAIGKRVIKPEEIAEVCCFLISDASNCISGQVIACNEANVLFDN